jgi:hypothetical protein
MTWNSIDMLYAVTRIGFNYVLITNNGQIKAFEFPVKEGFVRRRARYNESNIVNIELLNTDCQPLGAEYVHAVAFAVEAKRNHERLSS